LVPFILLARLGRKKSKWLNWRQDTRKMSTGMSVPLPIGPLFVHFIGANEPRKKIQRKDEILSLHNTYLTPQNRLRHVTACQFLEVRPGEVFLGAALSTHLCDISLVGTPDKTRGHESESPLIYMLRQLDIKHVSLHAIKFYKSS
jgi:hypothetical protein